MAKTTVAKGPEITAENATEPVDHHNDEVSQSATLVLRNLGVYILARYKNFPPPSGNSSLFLHGLFHFFLFL